MAKGLAQVAGVGKVKIFITGNAVGWWDFWALLPSFGGGEDKIVGITQEGWKEATKQLRRKRRGL